MNMVNKNNNYLINRKLITIISFMNKLTLINCLLLLFLNTINSCLGTIRTIFVAKKSR